MNDFTASNGVRLIQRDGGSTYDLLSSDGDNMFEDAEWLGSQDMDALREFFQAEADERLGRWRWRQEPEFVAYWNPVLGHLTVVYEPAGGSTVFERNSMRPEPLGGKPAAVARAYFDAHSEPKPWHDAKPGEVWAFTLDDAPLAAAFTSRCGGEWVGAVTGLPVSLRSVTAARRIWPEVSS